MTGITSKVTATSLKNEYTSKQVSLVVVTHHTVSPMKCVKGRYILLLTCNRVPVWKVLSSDWNPARFGGFHYDNDGFCFSDRNMTLSRTKLYDQ